MISNKASEAAAEDGNEAKAEAEAFERRIKKLEAEKSELSRKLQEKSNALQELVSQVRSVAVVWRRKIELFNRAKMMMLTDDICGDGDVLVCSLVHLSVHPSIRPAV